MSGSIQERTLGDIADHVGGRVVGDPKIVIRAAATIERADEGDISFFVNRKYERQLQTTKASAIIVGQEMPSLPVAQVVAEDAYFAFQQVQVLLYGHRNHQKVGVSPRASIAATARIGANCHIHDFVTVADNAQIGDGCVVYPCTYVGEDVRIGSDSILYPSVTIYEGCRIGSRVIVNANSVVGADGFGFATHDGVHHKIPQVGGVIIEDDVEIGSGCSIERGALDDTVIGEGSKVGDLVAIGHGTRVGPYCLLVAQVGIAGSTTLGHHCVMGGQVGVVGHINIGDNVTIGAQAGVINSIADGETVLGAPVIDAGQARRAYTMLQYLPQMRQDIRTLQNRLKKMTDPATESEPDAATDSRDSK